MAPGAAAAAARGVGARLGPRVEELARQTATAVRLGDLYRWGQGDVGVRMQFARFLHREIAIRNAQLCKELGVLPFGLAETEGVSEIIRGFSGYVDRIAESSVPETAEDDPQFIEMLSDILEDRVRVVTNLCRGVHEIRDAMGEQQYEGIRSEVDHILDRFFIKRIGLRFLLTHYIEAARNEPGTSGIIHSNVGVGSILRQEAREAVRICKDTYGASPDIIIVGDGQQRSSVEDGMAFGSSVHGNPDLSFDRAFTYVPIHLQFSCGMLLRSACFATAERYVRERKAREAHVGGGGGGSAASTAAPRGASKEDDMPPVQAIFSYGEEEVAIKVSDEGGGIPSSQQHLAWSYFVSAPRGSGAFAEDGPEGWRRSSLFGLSAEGVGLPLARLHARYYGGDLLLKSIEGFGTDVHMFLNRLGHNCERLPHGVRLSPAMRDSSLAEGGSLAELGTLTPFEASFLRQRLAQFRRQRAASSTSPF